MQLFADVDDDFIGTLQLLVGVVGRTRRARIALRDRMFLKMG